MTVFKNKMALLAALLALVVALPTLARADDITDEIEAALQLYNEGRIAEAKEALDFAAQLLTQKKAASLSGYLPEALDDSWQQVGDDDNMAAAQYGGGIGASRTFSNGAEECIISIVGDSPMMQMLTMMFTNPSMVNASGGRMQRIGGERAVITQDGDIQLLVNNYLIMGSGRTCSEENRIAYVTGVDTAGLKAF